MINKLKKFRDELNFHLQKLVKEAEEKGLWDDSDFDLDEAVRDIVFDVASEYEVEVCHVLDSWGAGSEFSYEAGRGYMFRDPETDREYVADIVWTGSGNCVFSCYLSEFSEVDDE